MTNDLEFRLHRVTLTPDLKGRITKPAVSLSDKEFQYVPAIRTNLAETFRKAREKLEAA